MKRNGQLHATNKNKLMKTSRQLHEAKKKTGREEM
jgi:hypothetical protein